MSINADSGTKGTGVFHPPAVADLADPEAPRPAKSTEPIKRLAPGAPPPWVVEASKVMEALAPGNASQHNLLPKPPGPVSTSPTGMTSVEAAMAAAAVASAASYDLQIIPSQDPKQAFMATLKQLLYDLGITAAAAVAAAALDVVNGTYQPPSTAIALPAVAPGSSLCSPTEDVAPATAQAYSSCILESSRLEDSINALSLQQQPHQWSCSSSSTCLPPHPPPPPPPPPKVDQCWHLLQQQEGEHLNYYQQQQQQQQQPSDAHELAAAAAQLAAYTIPMLSSALLSTPTETPSLTTDYTSSSMSPAYPLQSPHSSSTSSSTVPLLNDVSFSSANSSSSFSISLRNYSRSSSGAMTTNSDRGTSFTSANSERSSSSGYLLVPLSALEPVLSRGDLAGASASVAAAAHAVVAASQADQMQQGGELPPGLIFQSI